ncbi:hypothetical protein C482_08788 [Natrialba chahannaoensis JCM 10990]|uniref:Uncharacterized protein n=1 Tax=Natrialba chahannaoensis JCM 10990 TaxID=1227492 RepID=M0AQ80_9EURY|nr:hypothetical protein [Natrialba chahannaoensis]ELZ00705.1 hypothetical protein C482_08788 [Natrialba chahannaoensis JCM 10990]
MESTNSRTGSIRPVLVLGGCALVAAIVYVGLVPQALLAGDASRALLFLVLGWVPYTIVFYAIGRLISSPEQLPNMRAADFGLAAFLVSLLLSLGLDAWGFSPEQVPAAHVMQGVGIFVGLALFGWGLGRRSHAVVTASSDTASSDRDR